MMGLCKWHLNSLFLVDSGFCAHCLHGDLYASPVYASSRHKASGKIGVSKLKLTTSE